MKRGTRKIAELSMPNGCWVLLTLWRGTYTLTVVREGLGAARVETQHRDTQSATAAFHAAAREAISLQARTEVLPQDCGTE